MANHVVSLGDASTENKAKVTNTGSLITTLSPALGIEEQIVTAPFTEYFTLNHDQSTRELSVDASLTNFQEAFVTGRPEGDFYITALSILLADDNSTQPNRFGAINGGITNGVDVFYSIPNGRVVLGNAKVNFDFLRLGWITPGLGDNNNAYQVSNLNVDNDNGYAISIDLAKLSPFDLGIRLRQNSNDKFGVRLQDDLSSVNTFNILAIGYLRLINENGE